MDLEQILPLLTMLNPTVRQNIFIFSFTILFAFKNMYICICMSKSSGASVRIYNLLLS